MRECAVCKINIDDRKDSAKTCSPKCRKELSRLESVTPNVTLETSFVTPEIWFEFFTVTKANGLGRKEEEKSDVRKARYWYQVPLAAIPIIKKGWPRMPEYMNGRQYFLWWKNEFKMNSDKPEIHNPFPASDRPVTYVQAGDNSRHWGTN